MDRSRRGGIATAFILIAIGVWFLFVELDPGVHALAYGATTWPYQIVGAGGLLALAGVLTWTPGLLIPACIVGGIGGLLYWQNLTGDWASWAYVWTLIPGFVAVGLILFGLLTGRRGAVIGGIWNLFSSLLLFGIFGSAFGRLAIAGMLWPLALILLGLIFLFQFWLRPRRAH